MTDDRYQPELVKASWDRVRPAGDLFAARFYATLFSVHPELRAKFPVSMRAQRVHLFQALDVIVGRCDRLTDPATLTYLAAIGRRHATRAEPAHYDMVAGALLATLAHYDPAWDDETADNWAVAYGFVAGAMRDAAEDILTVPMSDPTPRWYHVYGLKRLDAYTSRVMLEADERATMLTSIMWATVLGRPGWWVSTTPLGPEYAPEGLAESVRDGDLIVADVRMHDHRTRALALARPGQRVLVAPEVNP